MPIKCNDQRLSPLDESRDGETTFKRRTSGIGRDPKQEKKKRKKILTYETMTT